MGDLAGSCFPVSPLAKDTIQGVGITRSLFTRRDGQRGSAASKPQTTHAASTCRNGYTGWGRARGGGLGPQDAWVLGSSASTGARTQRTGLLPHGWNLVTLARKEAGTRGVESGQSTALDSV